MLSLQNRMATPRASTRFMALRGLGLTAEVMDDGSGGGEPVYTTTTTAPTTTYTPPMTDAQKIASLTSMVDTLQQRLTAEIANSKQLGAWLDQQKEISARLNTQLAAAYAEIEKLKSEVATERANANQIHVTLNARLEEAKAGLGQLQAMLDAEKANGARLQAALDAALATASNAQAATAAAQAAAAQAATSTANMVSAGGSAAPAFTTALVPSPSGAAAQGAIAYLKEHPLYVAGGLAALVGLAVAVKLSK